MCTFFDTVLVWFWKQTVIRFLMQLRHQLYELLGFERKKCPSAFVSLWSLNALLREVKAKLWFLRVLLQAPDMDTCGAIKGGIKLIKGVIKCWNWGVCSVDATVEFLNIDEKNRRAERNRKKKAKEVATERKRMGAGTTRAESTLITCVDSVGVVAAMV